MQPVLNRRARLGTPVLLPQLPVGLRLLRTAFTSPNATIPGGSWLPQGAGSLRSASMTGAHGRWEPLGHLSTMPMGPSTLCLLPVSLPDGCDAVCPVHLRGRSCMAARGGEATGTRKSWLCQILRPKWHARHMLAAITERDTYMTGNPRILVSPNSVSLGCGLGRDCDSSIQV